MSSPPPVVSCRLVSYLVSPCGSRVLVTPSTVSIFLGRRSTPLATPLLADPPVLLELVDEPAVALGRVDVLEPAISAVEVPVRRDRPTARRDVVRPHERDVRDIARSQLDGARRRSRAAHRVRVAARPVLERHVRAQVADRLGGEHGEVLRARELHDEVLVAVDVRRVPIGPREAHRRPGGCEARRLVVGISLLEAVDDGRRCDGAPRRGEHLGERTGGELAVRVGERPRRAGVDAVPIGQEHVRRRRRGGRIFAGGEEELAKGRRAGLDRLRGVSGAVEGHRDDA
mmetsp:Transcript_5894/g.24663  ORF Transcript_5894/g.24663 Transcript_5894/m.24663 type:complete len:286 (+) Transcript_5894:528-1385(+)